MFRVRFYDQTFHPDRFNVGFWGLVIRSLNWLRWRLEVYVQKLVLGYISKTGAVPSDRAHQLRKMFDLDDRAERLEKERTSPKIQPVEVPIVDAPLRADKYAGGAQSSLIDQVVEAETGVPQRPTKLDNLIGMYAPALRAKSYARGRHYTTGDPEGDFEPVVVEDVNGR